MTLARKGFTLVELLVVIAILAMLFAFLFPVFVSARAAVHQMGTSRALKDAWTAAALYTADYGDVYPLAMYWEPDGIRAWFGKYQGDDVDFDHEQGLIAPYLKSQLPTDKALQAQRYFGDWSGIGYNWGVIGSDFHLTGQYQNWPNCRNASSTTAIEDPANTVVFATSSYYAAPWAGGDGQRYLFGFFDPPSLWHGVPNVDFRHLGETTVDESTQEVTSTGNAIFSRSDGSTITIKQAEIDANHFWRTPLPE